MTPSDLASYLRRINYQGDTSPTFEVLNQVTLAHARSIAFENVDVVLNRPILLSDEGIFDKLVTRKRGGYCFEQNGLLLNVLGAMGFHVRPISGRVRLRFTDRAQIGPRTHVFLRVELNGESFLTDVGMGSASLTGALRLSPDVVQPTPHDSRRLVRDGALWYHQISYTGVWQDACEFTLEEMPLIDREIANWYTSAHPQSHFRDRLVAARALDTGCRISLENFDFTVRNRDGGATKTQLQSIAELGDVLVQKFGIELNENDRELLRGVSFLSGDK